MKDKIKNAISEERGSFSLKPTERDSIISDLTKLARSYAGEGFPKFRQAVQARLGNGYAAARPHLLAAWKAAQQEAKQEGLKGGESKKGLKSKAQGNITHSDNAFMTRFFTPSIILRLAAAVMLFYALKSGLPFDYFTLLRVIVCGVAIYITVLTFKQSQHEWAWVFGTVAILFNPIAQVTLERRTWAIIDIACGLIFLSSIYFAATSSKGTKVKEKKQTLSQRNRIIPILVVVISLALAYGSVRWLEHKGYLDFNQGSSRQLERQPRQPQQPRQR